MAARSSTATTADSIFEEEHTDEGLSAIDDSPKDDGGGVPVEEEVGRLGLASTNHAIWMICLKWNLKALCRDVG